MVYMIVNKGLVSSPACSASVSTSRHVGLEGQPTQEDMLVWEGVVRVGSMSGTLGHFEAAAEEAFLGGSRSREWDWTVESGPHSFSEDQPR